MLEMSLLGVGTVLLLENDAWSMVRRRQETNEYARPSPPLLSPPHLLPRLATVEMQSQTQARTLSEQTSKVRQLVFQGRQREAELVASRLESARAEAVAERNAAEIDRLRESKVRSVPLACQHMSATIGATAS